MSTEVEPMRRLAYNVEEFAARAGMSVRAVRHQAQNGALPFRKQGRRWLIGAKTAEQYFEKPG